ncbi:MAG: TIGR03013 family PEP-CTERM/XrtA system glycosyltransferase [Gammaproteobacteria bacterium]|nr:TIGR03013 family PEP-CTERM/XrtA system glycosyltransferase [Gammaproteobacteria bacterium]MCP5137410.1 TIGR03013 family PEP-CTERM/XrtA system glycosyltransferase [Gammaproteobacteria bacterium]
MQPCSVTNSYVHFRPKRLMKTGYIRLFKHFLPGTYLLLMALEISLLVGAFLLSSGLLLPPESLLPTQFKQAVGMAAMMIMGMVAMGMYNARIRSSVPDTAFRLLAAFTIMVAGVLAVGLLLPVQMPSPLEVTLGMLIGFGLLLMVRSMFGKFVVDLDMWDRRVLVIGAGKAAHQVAGLHHSPLEFRAFVPVGYVPMASDEIEEPAPSMRRLVPGAELIDLVRAHEVDEVVVATDCPCDSGCVDQLLPIKMVGVPVIEMIDFIEREGGKIDLHALSPDWMVFAEGFTQGAFRRMTKRLVDLVASGLLLAVTWPVLLLAMLAIKLDDGGPIFYEQTRVGAYGRHFGVLKLRSMRVDAEKGTGAVWASANDDRTTRIGGWLRKMRIDELPQLLNIFRGEMSFVGPRPERPEFVRQLADKIPHYGLREIVKPGLTGWAQINYPYGASDDDAWKKHELDLYYVKNHSLFLDVMIIMQTVEVILWGRGR